MLVLALVPLTILAAVLMQTAGDIPAWFLGLLPVLNFGITELFVRFGKDLTTEQKKNISLAVAAVLFSALWIFGQIAYDSPLPTGSDPQLWVPWLLGLFTWLWKGSNVMNDLIDMAATRKTNS